MTEDNDHFLYNTDFLYDPSYLKKLKFIISVIKKYSKDTNKKLNELDILEVGCGKGGITIPISSLGCKIRAFDMDKEDLIVIKRQIKINNIDNIIVSEDNALTFTSKRKFDLIIVSEVFEHVTNPMKMALNLKESLNDDAQIIITVPNGYGPWELRNRLFYYPIFRSNIIRKLMNKSRYIKETGRDHCQFFTEKQIILLFSRLGFKKIAFKKSDSILAILPPYQRIQNIDIKLADILPSKLASGWYFVFKLE